MIDLTQYIGTEQYDSKLWTYGSEFEVADIDKRLPIPNGLTWDFKDTSVMNSNGVATDPRVDGKRIVQYGGELNTIPCSSIAELVGLFTSLKETCSFTVNNTCNLHNHIRVPDLTLTGLKAIVAYFELYHAELVEYTDFIPEPDYSRCTPNEFKILEDRYVHHTKELFGSRHGKLPIETLLLKLNANTIEEFHEASIVGRHNQHMKHSWSVTVRAGINTLQMRRSSKKEYQHIPYDQRPYAESGTVEFRMHHMTTDVNDLRSSLVLDRELMYAALVTGESPRTIVERLSQSPDFRLPKYIQLDPELYAIYLQTKHKKKSDADLIAYLNKKGLKYE